MADDERELRALRTVADGDADVAGLPRLDRRPGMHLAIVELERSRVVDDHARIVGIPIRVELHDGEAAPDAIVAAGVFERGDLRPFERAHDLRIHVHRQAMQRIFGEDDEIHRRHVAARLADRRHDLLRLRGEVRGGDDDGQLQLHDADNDAVRRFVETAESVHRCSCRSEVRRPLTSPSTIRRACRAPSAWRSRSRS